MIQLYRLGSMPVAKVLQYLDAANSQNIYVVRLPSFLFRAWITLKAYSESNRAQILF